ncbi:MAG: ATP-binding cassette domain-containing protein [Puniceicoccales bacterium]|jgi:polar amino acid transport system ATP-binding protein|nr:ATP-binding cassette domain-containing protein [Puniceicoccales bacterium]
MITAEKIFKSFGTCTVLNGINLAIGAGSTIGLAGPSGSGKSTLLRCIQGLESPDSGRISREGYPGFMFQDFQLFPHMTVWDNILYAPRVRKLFPRAYLEAKADRLLRHLAIGQCKDRYPTNLSGGQKQRVALARTLILGPDILLCDEPTSGLDVAATGDVVALLKSIQNEETTIVVASHNLDFLVQISNRIILLKNGSIGADIVPQELEDPIVHLRGLCD